jgi:hypothetical protein
MRKDLAALARNRAVTDVIIVSAEEDLAPAIAEVQEFGVRTVLLHIGADGGGAGSRALRQECDDVIEVSGGHLRPFVELIVGAEPQFTGTGYREQPVSSGAPQAVIDTAGPRLFESVVPAGYERAAALPAVGGLGQDQRDLAASDAASFATARHVDGGHAGPVQRAPEVQPPQPAQPAAAAQYRQAADPLGAVGETGYGQPSFAGQGAPSAANGHGGSGQQGLTLSAGQASMGAPVMTGNGLAQPGLPGPAVGGMPAPGAAANGVSANGVPGGLPGYGVEAVGGGRPGVPRSLEASGPSQPGPAAVHYGVGSGGFGQPQGLPAAGQGMTGPQLAAQPPPQSLGQQSASPSQVQQSQAQPGMVQPAMVQPGSPAAQPGAHRHAGGPQGQNGPLPLESQRPALPARQLPAGNGLPYGQDQRMPYAGQLPQPQFAGSAGQQPYPPVSYAAQPAQLPAPPPSVGDAVQAAHAEGFGFGEAVARDAPALWLEAVLARKPRMPSDLEARLLQGSALPIDSLLHDEVRHALRRGFWDALERSRH